jgi:hypothetical protein
MIVAMAMARREKPTEQQLQGFKHLRKLLPLFERLHDVGTRPFNVNSKACLESAEG